MRHGSKTRKLAKNIARYLTGIKNMQLEMQTGAKDNLLTALESYSYAGFAADKGDSVAELHIF